MAAFSFLKDQTTLHGGSVLPRRVLERGFDLNGRRVPLLGPQGIFKPAGCELPLSITTVPEVPGKERPYEDETTYEGVDSGNRLVANVINGESSVVAFVEGAVVSVLALSVTDHLISRVYVVSDQRKLAHVKRVLEHQN